MTSKISFTMIRSQQSDRNMLWRGSLGVQTKQVLQLACIGLIHLYFPLLYQSRFYYYPPMLLSLKPQWKPGDRILQWAFDFSGNKKYLVDILDYSGVPAQQAVYSFHYAPCPLLITHGVPNSAEQIPGQQSRLVTPRLNKTLASRCCIKKTII